MIVLDTNVVSEVMSEGSGVDRWLAEVRLADLYTTAMTRAEIRYGVALLPVGRRRDDLAARAASFFSDIWERTLLFDLRAADRYGELLAERDHRGHPMSVPDAVIASICWVNRARLATRNVKDFTGCDIEVIDPFAT